MNETILKEDLEKSCIYLLDLLELDEKAANTIRNYSNYLKPFMEAMPQIIDKRILIQYKKDLSTRLKTSTVNNHLIAINQLIKTTLLLNERNDISLSDIKQYRTNLTLKPLKIQKRSSLNESEVLTQADFKKLLRWAKKLKKYDMYYIMMILGMTGIRISELRYFTFEAIQENNIIVTNKGKTRAITMPGALRRDLINYCLENGIKGHIFTDSKGEDMKYHTIYKNMHTIARSSRGILVKKVHPHAFRHYFAMNYLAHTPNPLELADILGHSSLETSMIYARSTQSMKQTNINKLYKTNPTGRKES